MKKLRVLDLFSGCGGLSLGFQNAGYDVVGAIDNWLPAVDVYSDNFDHPIFNVDLNNVGETTKIVKKLKANVIVGGPPCQDFSHAGKRDENGGRANLTISFAKIIRENKPLYFVMENVDRIQKTSTYKEAKKIFQESGYGLTEKLLDASLCGVPQKRKRFFVIGILGGKDNVLESILTSSLSPKPMTLRDYFGEEIDFEHYYRHPRNYNRRAVFSIDEPSPTVRGVNRPKAKGYPGHPNDTNQNLEEVRPLTAIERSHIQTFPKDFKFGQRSKSDLEQLIGNAVPVKLGEYVAQSLKEYIETGVKEEVTDQDSLPLKELKTSRC
jgi:DNA (cytosine-5)-methyltransferase 1